MHVNPWFILITIGGFIFPLMRVLGLLKDLDERELIIDQISGNFTLFFIVFSAMFCIILNLELKGDALLLFILAPLIIKSTIFISLTYPKDLIISYLGRITGSLLILFALLSHGFSTEGLIESIPGIIILILSEFSKRFRFLGIIFFILFLLLFYFFFRNGVKLGLLITFIILSAPLISLGVISLKGEE